MFSENDIYLLNHRFGWPGRAIGLGDKLGQISGRPIGETIYVSKSGNDSYDGLTWGTAKLTIQEAVDTITDSVGALILVGPGKYQENVLIYGKDGVTIRALVPGWESQMRPSDGATKITFTAGGIASAGVAFAVLSRSVTIEGFCLDAGGAYDGIYVGDGYAIDTGYNKNTASARIINNLFRGGAEGKRGLFLDGCSDNVIVEGNVFEDFVNGGLFISAGGSRTVQRPIIRYNEFLGNQGYGIYMKSDASTVNCLVRGNSFTDKTGGTAMTRSCIFQGAGVHYFVGNFDASANGAIGSATDFMSGNTNEHAMNAPVYIAEA